MVWVVFRKLDRARYCWAWKVGVGYGLGILLWLKGCCMYGKAEWGMVVERGWVME